ncbi:MAG: sugar phosphate nucleotidyltransferase [Planctomycetota bacterium]
MTDAAPWAVVLAAGAGSRMRQTLAAPEQAGLSHEQLGAAARGAKAMMPVAGRPFLDYALHNLAEAGFTRVCLVISPAGDELRTWYTSHPPRRLQVAFAVQTAPRGTADAVLAAEVVVATRPCSSATATTPTRSPCSPPCAPPVCPPLRLFPVTLLPAHRGAQARDQRLRAFADLEIDGDGNLAAIHEKPEYTPRAVSMNCWYFDARIFDACRRVTPSARGELELPDAVRLAMAAGMVARRTGGRTCARPLAPRRHPRSAGEPGRTTGRAMTANLRDWQDQDQACEALRRRGMTPDGARRHAEWLTGLAQAAHADGLALDTPVHAVYCPGRLEVLGKHTDYGGGRSLVAAPELGIVCLAWNTAAPEYHATSRAETRPWQVSRAGLTGELPEHWGRYPQVVAARLERLGLLPPGGAQLRFAASLPLAAGMRAAQRPARHHRSRAASDSPARTRTLPHHPRTAGPLRRLPGERQPLRPPGPATTAAWARSAAARTTRRCSAAAPAKWSAPRTIPPSSKRAAGAYRPPLLGRERRHRGEGLWRPRSLQPPVADLKRSRADRAPPGGPCPRP